MARALYIGRFQIVHLGHLDVLRTIDGAPDIDEILIALGSTQYDHTNKSPEAPWSVNPFTAAERREMLESALDGQLTKPWSVYEVPDYHDWDRWYAHIALHLPAFEVLYSSSRNEHAYFSMKGYDTRRFPVRFDFHAGSIRKALATGEPWRHAVPPTTAALCDRIGAASRLTELYARDAQEASDG